MVKVTFTLDDETIATLRRTAARTRKPQSHVVREAVREYGERADKLSPEEQARKLAILDEILSRPPRRTQAEVDAEIREIRRARRHGGRRTRVE